MGDDITYKVHYPRVTQDHNDIVTVRLECHIYFLFAFVLRSLYHRKLVLALLLAPLAYRSAALMRASSLYALLVRK